jgi:hypothetical protein
MAYRQRKRKKPWSPKPVTAKAAAENLAKQKAILDLSQVNPEGFAGFGE